MKKFIFVVLIITLFCRISSAKSDSIEIINNVKFELTNLIYCDYSLSMERKIGNAKSLSLRLGYLVPFNYLMNKFDIEIEGKRNGFDTSIEYRFFLIGPQKENLQGIYIAPYVRYAKLNMDFLDEIQYSPFSATFGYSNIGAGVQFGVQGKLKGNNFLEHIVYDFHFFGGGVDMHAIKITYQSLKNPDEFNYGSLTEDVSRIFEKYPFLERKLDFGILDNILNVKLPVVLPGFRSGFSIGYSF